MHVHFRARTLKILNALYSLTTVGGWRAHHFVSCKIRYWNNPPPPQYLHPNISSSSQVRSLLQYTWRQMACKITSYGDLVLQTGPPVF